METAPQVKVAIVHDWLQTPGGAELVLGEMLAVFPGADVFTMIDKRSAESRSNNDNDSGALAAARITTSWLQRVPGIARSYRSWLPLMPLALRSLDVSGYDVVISNSHAVAKGIRTHERQLHLCYCLSPMRYAWDLKGQYLREAGLERGVRGLVAGRMLEAMRRWDLANTGGVDAFATLSQYIAERIERAYGRSAEVIYPPVDTEFFTPAQAGVRGEGEARRGATGEGRSGEERRAGSEDTYVTASRFVPYKRIDMIARAFALMPEKKLVIVGDGPDVAKVRAAAGQNVMLVGRESRERLRERLRGARAFLFAAEEDFGIAPVEAQACGTPVIAFGRGGVTETVRGLDAAEPTGVLYAEQTVEGLAEAVRRFEALTRPISAEACRANALRFGTEIFRERFRSFVEGKVEKA